MKVLKKINYTKAMIIILSTMKILIGQAIIILKRELNITLKKSILDA